ncbi:MAG: nitroreductase [Lachnospiraceae bacterium]|nr:nitroreductase [Lachnospiraceae bacterium]
MSEFLKLVKQRRSVRTFDGKALDESIKNDLAKYAEGLSNPFGVNIKFVFLDAKENNLSSPVLAGDTFYVSAVVDKTQKNMDEAYGYAFEDFLIYAHKLGLGTVWIGGTMPRDKFEEASKLGENEVMPCVSPLGKTAKKMAVKESLMRKGVKADTRIDFEKLFFLGDFDTPLTEEKAKELDLYEALEAVRVAPSAVNKQPWRVVIDGNKAHFYEKHDSGFINPDYDLQKIDVGIGLYHFDAVLKEMGKTTAFSYETPGITMPDQTDYVVSVEF